MNATLTKVIADNLFKINQNLAKIRVSSMSQKCQLLAVSKTKPITDILSAYDAGQRHFGENYVEEFCEKAQHLQDTHQDINWHFIGHI